jgi:hypothetical protein
MGRSDGIEQVPGLPGVFKIGRGNRIVSLPTRWRPKSVEKDLKGFPVTRHKPPPDDLDIMPYRQWHDRAMTLFVVGLPQGGTTPVGK